MNEVIKLEEVQNKIIQIHGKSVILDHDVAKLYGVLTRRINEAVKNNPEKFPDGYLIQLSKSDKTELVENFDRFNSLKHSTVNPKAFTEKGLYMLATILKSPKATETTLSIIETFAKVREIANVIKKLPTTKENTPQYKAIAKKTGALISDLVVPDELETSGSEASIEVNLAVVKFKYSITKKSK
jgi:hypothetical protein